MRLETPEHIARENAIAQTLSRVWRCEVIRQPDFSPVDWHLFRHGKLIAVGEFRGRNIYSYPYEKIWLEVAKWEAITRLSQCCHVHGIWVVEFLNPQIRWIEAKDCAGFDREIGGRTDRGLEEDIDEMICVPVYQMKKVVDVKG